MKFHLTHKHVAKVRNFDYSARKPVDESDAWKHVGEREPYAGEDVGFRLWGQNGTGRMILLINCNESYLALGGGFPRLMDIYQQHVSVVRPWRIFAAVPVRNGGGLILELAFSRDRDEYRLLDYAPVMLRQLRELLNDDGVHPSYVPD